jgi:MFS family permease
MFCVLPVFLTGALAVQIRADLGFGPQEIGLVLACFFFSTGLTSAPLGRLVERLGPVRGALAATLLGVASLLGVAVSSEWPHLLLALIVGGLANATSQPSANLYLMRGVRSGRRGLAFGLKQAAIPAATLTAGAAVPTFGILIGWRWAFVVAAIVAVLTVLTLRRHDPSRSASTMRDRTVAMVGAMGSGAGSRTRTRGLVILALAGGVGSAAAVPLGTFLVLSGVSFGFPEGLTGLLLAVAGAVGLVARVFFGWTADRRPQRDHFRFIAILLGFGSIGFGALASGLPVAFVLGAVVGFGAGWGWTGLFHFAVLHHFQQSPAAATGFIQSGLSIGAGLGPLMFGLLAERASYHVAWVAAGLLALTAAGIVLVGQHYLSGQSHETTTGRPA